MSFLNLSLLWGLVPLVGLPLVVHLLNKRFPRLFYFSNVKNIRETIAQRSWLFRWRHWILMALRTLFLLLVLIAFLKPVLEKFGLVSPGQDSRQVLLMLDHSLSMEYKGELVSCRQRAIQEAEKVIDSLSANDVVNVMLAGRAPSSCFVEFSPDHAEAKRFLSRTQPGLTKADFTQANAAAARLLSRINRRSEIYYFSDFQRKSWAHVDFSSLPPQTRLFFVDVATRAKDNRAILEVALDQSHFLAGDTVPLEITVGNFSDQPMKERITAVIDQRVSFEKEVSAPPWSTAQVILPVLPGAPGLHLCEVHLPPDDLDADNRFCLALPVLEKEEILIVSDDPKPSQDAVFYLKSALNPYVNQQGSLLPRHLTSAELSSGQLAAAKKIFLTRTGLLNDAAAALLAKFLFSGGGIVYFLDGDQDAANLERLEKAIGPGTMPIKLGTRRVADNGAASAQQITQGDFKSKYLRLFRGSRRQDLALLEFYDFYRASSTGAGNVLLTYADETPAMAVLGHGLGTLILMNCSVGEFSSNLARQRMFPAWIQDLVKQLTSEEPTPTASVVGETLQAEVWRSELKDHPFKSPSGRDVELKRELLGERCAISFVPEELGFYTLRNDRLRYAFGVNPPPEESDLRPVDKSLLPDLLKDGQQGRFVSGAEDYQNLIRGKPVFHYWIFAGLVLLTVELVLQWIINHSSLNPKSNPHNSEKKSA